jgi:uncharacterized membrane protein YoaK (UPF0700 family)
MSEAPDAARKEDWPDFASLCAGAGVGAAMSAVLDGEIGKAVFMAGSWAVIVVIARRIPRRPDDAGSETQEG